MGHRSPEAGLNCAGRESDPLFRGLSTMPIFTILSVSAETGLTSCVAVVFHNHGASHLHFVILPNQSVV